MEGFFDNLVMAVKAERSTLDELMKINSVLTETNDRLMRRIAALEKEAKNKPASGGGGGVAATDDRRKCTQERVQAAC